MSIDRLLHNENATIEQLVTQKNDTSPVFSKATYNILVGVIVGRILTLSSVIDALNEQEGEPECRKSKSPRK